LILKSCFGSDELEQRWDERTSPARFAGNDGVMDDIFIASRKGTRVFLIRKGRNTWDPFSTVFRGRIFPSGSGSFIKGYFSKRYFDYVLLVFLAIITVYFAYQDYFINGFSASSILFYVSVISILTLLAIPLPSARKKYMAFMKEIADKEI
jgi:hypothetical protein